jgi:hemolysin III
MIEPNASQALPRPMGDAPVGSGGFRITPETANQITHALGFGLSLIGAWVMLSTVWPQPGGVRFFGCAVYVASLVALYGASTLSHSFEDPRRRSFFRLIDQLCILLLVAGTYTPFGLVHGVPGRSHSILAAMWVLALGGIASRVRKGDGSMAIVFCVMIGWLPVLSLGRIYDVSGLEGLLLVVGGGVAYTGGTLFLINDARRPYLHAAWHLCTILGSALHFLFLQWYVAEWPVA